MTMVHSLAVPKAFAAKEKGKLKNYVNVVSEGDVVFKNVRDLAASLVRYPTYEHLKVVVISEELARTFDLRKVMDFLLRNSETRRSIKVMISQNKAKDVFEPVPPLESNSALKLSELADAASQTLTIAPKLKLGEMSARLSAGTSFVMQRVTMTKQGAKLSGGAVIRGSDGKWIGWLDENAMQGLNLMLKGTREGTESSAPRIRTAGHGSCTKYVSSPAQSPPDQGRPNLLYYEHRDGRKAAGRLEVSRECLR
ncbi:Ger(x)C family spore germination C-terminal domain-containing protein [Paenibacillus sp. P26]|nr:Ger(x)C family spore germination C-terminal domain-containing protein [Paenibacillus sp. P26]